MNFLLVFGLDSPLGLFPPGMDPSKMYNPLMDLPEHHPAHRSLHPDHQPFLKKKCKEFFKEGSDLVN